MQELCSLEDNYKSLSKLKILGMLDIHNTHSGTTLSIFAQIKSLSVPMIRVYQMKTRKHCTLNYN